MNEALLFKLADVLLNAVAIGLEADALRSKVKELELAGKNAGEVADAIRAMRDEALAKARAVTG
jgi:hypothetical protein